ncbi:MAG: T9SS type A sorting domain-containing protein [Chitinophagaceae bacterium]|nr:T9SS type A sorting domain-containing protein [Chitinophagaceae bacterium]
MNNYTSAEPVFTATAPGSYTLTCTVTNKYGCTSTCSVTICVTDVRVPGTSNKVYLCHTDAGGSNPTTLAVNTSAVDNHLSVHGDKLGKCGETPCAQQLISRSSVEEIIINEETPFSVKVLPNPSSNYFTLQVQSDLKEHVEIRVTDLQGRRVYNTRGNAASFRFGETFVKGIYLVEVVQGDQKRVLKLIKHRTHSVYGGHPPVGGWPLA